MSIFGKLFGKKKEQWYMVADWVRQGSVFLVGLKRTIELEESVFGSMLIAAKINGWSGGNEFFIVSNGDGVLKQIDAGMSIRGEDALKLATNFFEFTDKEGGDEYFKEELWKICQEGGFYIEIP